MLLSLLLFTASAAVPTASATPADFAEFDHSLASHQLKQAAAFIDKQLVVRAPADGSVRSDPVLNALIGRLVLHSNQAASAVAYLDQAPIAALPAEIKASAALDHGKALETIGARKAALAAYREAQAVSSSEADRRRAALGIARQLLAENAASARELATPFANGPAAPDRWQSRAILAQAAQLLGDNRSAQVWADQAWADAAGAPVEDLAPLRVTTLRAGIAAARGDVANERAMLTAANGLSLTASGDLGGQLPVCGDSGTRPGDQVTFGYADGPFGTRQLFPIAASRPEVVAAFQDAYAGAVPIKEVTGTTPLGTIFTVSCRSVVASQFTANDVVADPLLAWLTASGIYGALALNDSNDTHLNAVAARIDAVAARFGQDSPQLIGPRWQMLTMLEQRARAGDQVLPGQLFDLSKEVAEGMRRAGAPAWIAEVVEARPRLMQAVAASEEGPEQFATATREFRDQLMRLPFRLAHQSLIDFTRNFHEDWPSALAQIVLDLDARAPADLTLRERQAWLQTVARAHIVRGEEREAHAKLASGGFEKDLCLATDSPPKLLEQHFTYDDYPEALLAGEQAGSVLFDFDLSPTGAVARRRVVYSLPSNLFDVPSAKGLATVRYTAPKRGGKAAPCRGLFQPIVWRLEKMEEWTPPKLTPELGTPTT